MRAYLVVGVPRKPPFGKTECGDDLLDLAVVEGSIDRRPVPRVPRLLVKPQQVRLGLRGNACH